MSGGGHVPTFNKHPTVVPTVFKNSACVGRVNILDVRIVAKRTLSKNDVIFAPRRIGLAS